MNGGSFGGSNLPFLTHASPHLLSENGEKFGFGCENLPPYRPFLTIYFQRKLLAVCVLWGK